MTSIRRPSKMEFVMASVCVGAAKPDVAELKTASVKRRFWVYHGRGAESAISIKMLSYGSQDRRASTPLTARLSPIGGHQHARPERRVPTSRMYSRASS